MWFVEETQAGEVYLISPKGRRIKAGAKKWDGKRYVFEPVETIDVNTPFQWVVLDPESAKAVLILAFMDASIYYEYESGPPPDFEKVDNGFRYPKMYFLMEKGMLKRATGKLFYLCAESLLSQRP